jgi:hypothetical protein
MRDAMAATATVHQPGLISIDSITLVCYLTLHNSRVPIGFFRSIFPCVDPNQRSTSERPVPFFELRVTLLGVVRR